MYAIIATGGKQYRVSEGDQIRVETLPANAGDTVNFDQVLLVGEGENVKIGAPYVEGCKVTGEVVTHGRGKKVRIIKMRRRKHYRKQMGHRQNFTEIKINAITD